MVISEAYTHTCPCMYVYAYSCVRTYACMYSVCAWAVGYLPSMFYHIIGFMVVVIEQLLGV